MPATRPALPARYAKPELLAYGGMADVYRATDASLGRSVAVKVLSERYASDDELHARFLREARTAASLSGEPNVIVIHDVGETRRKLPFIVIGSLLIIGGVATWVVVSTTLADQKITVSDDASCLAGDEVDGPFSAYCEAMVIDKHALEATGGLRYAELDREDPKRETAMTASFLQASLFTSVVAFGVAAMAVAVGVLFFLIGLGMRDVARRVGDVAGRTPAPA